MGQRAGLDSALVLVPYYLYQYYGDLAAVRSHYDGMRRYVDYLAAQAREGIVAIGLNDWAPYETETPAAVTSTAYFYSDAQVVSLAASLLGRDEDARHYARLGGQIKNAFNREFFQPATGSYANGSQTALSCALYHGLVEPGNRERVLQNLVENIERRQGHIDTGLLGAKYILNVLSENGRHEVAYRMAAQEDLPGWGWWIKQGATTLWEQWNGRDSRNHIMFGDISAWFFKTLAGINPDLAAPGFKHFRIQPRPAGDLAFARADYDSIHGLISSEWAIQDGHFKLRVVVPANTSATVFVPARAAAAVVAAGGPGQPAEDVKFLRMEKGAAVYAVTSGTHHFSARL